MGGHDAQRLWWPEVKLKPFLISTSVVAILLSPLWTSHLIWRLFPQKSLKMLIVDYTVPFTRYSHHRGIIWLLNYHRVSPPHEGSSWSEETDYLGYNPSVPENSKHLSEISLEAYDWIYLADTYGVYDTDLMKRKKIKIPRDHVPHLVFGGLTADDASALSNFTSEGNNIILEFNSFATPTEEPARKTVEELVGVNWTGWSGRFFPDLGNLAEVPTWYEKLFRLRYGDRPLPRGPGILFIHQSGLLVVLSNQSFEKSAPFFRTTRIGKEKYSASYGTPSYFGWFSIVLPRSSNTKILAEIILPNHYEWRKICRKARIPTVFPLITEFELAQSKRIYLAANLANIEDNPGMHTLAGIPTLQAALNRRRDTVSEKPAYWHIYVPMMGKMMTEFSSKPLESEEAKWRSAKDVLHNKRPRDTPFDSRSPIKKRN